MKLHITLVLGGLILFGSVGCSEKQKEAAQIEQEVKDLETASDSTSVVRDSATSAPGGLDTVRTATGESPSPSADPSAVPPESRQAVETTRPTQSTPSQPQPEAPKAPKEAMPPAPAGVGYTVQIASCESEDYARRLVARYTERGYQPFVTTVTYTNQEYYRVRVGHFQTVAEAKALRDELADRYSIKPWVDRTE